MKKILLFIGCVAATVLANAQVYFNPGVNYGANTNPISINTADFNGDGKADLAVANYGSNSVSILLGAGLGVFSTAVNYAVGSNPSCIIAEDFNGDGKIDLAISNYTSSYISVLLGIGNGTFATAVNYPVACGQRSLAAADFNGDGKKDLAVANYFVHTISILLGSGTGTFVPSAVNYATGSYPISVIAADLNGDGKSDLAVANYISNNVSVLIGSGTGTFATAVNYGAGSNPWALTSGDFNGDGKADLAIDNLGSHNVSVLMGAGSGTFVTAVNYAASSTPNSAPYSIINSDFNGDGILDLALTNYLTSNVSVLVGSGNGTFQPAINFGVGSCPHSLISADFNGDGIADLAVANNNSSNVTILLNGCMEALIPSFTGSTNFCSGAPLTFVGSDGPSTATNHSWLITECTSNGTQVIGGLSWYNWYAGSPGTYTFPSTIGVTCGKYYEVSLNVVNACVRHKQTSKIIYVTCGPSFKLKGSTSKICYGNQAILNATLNLGSNSTYTLNWTPISPAGPAIYNGPMAGVTVSPLVTTTYLCTVTDNITGCSTTMQWTVNVTINDPSFSFSNNTSNPNYYTLSATPNDLTAPSQPGFGYVWKVEELDANGNAIFLVDNSSCWWTFNPPTTIANNFNGFDHLTNNYSGNVTLANCSSPAAGMFLYNHTYRITRGTWNTLCGWKQYSQIANSIRSSNGNQMVVYTEDPNAPDVSYLMTGLQDQDAKDQLSIYPNPSNGIFTIEMSIDKKSSIEVYDALGKKVRSFEQVNFRSELDLSGFPKGMYLINIISEGKQISKKIILE